MPLLVVGSELLLPTFLVGVGIEEELLLPLSLPDIDDESVDEDENSPETREVKFIAYAQKREEKKKKMAAIPTRSIDWRCGFTRTERGKLYLWGGSKQQGRMSRMSTMRRKRRRGGEKERRRRKEKEGRRERGGEKFG